MGNFKHMCGLALPTGLTFLVILSLVGITSVNTARIETHSAHAFNMQNEVFHCTESGVSAVSECVANHESYCDKRISTVNANGEKTPVLDLNKIIERSQQSNAAITVTYNCEADNSYE